MINKNIRNKSYIYMENKQVDKKTHKTYNKNISLEMLSSLGAGDGNRTHVVSLEGWSSTIELHPHYMVQMERVAKEQNLSSEWY